MSQPKLASLLFDKSSTAQTLEKIEKKRNMAFHEFKFSEQELLGYTINVNTARIRVHINHLKQLSHTAVGKLVMIEIAAQEWIVGRVEAIEANDTNPKEIQYYLGIGFIGSFKIDLEKLSCKFSRAVNASANIGSQVYALIGSNLSFFMGGISQGNDPADLTLGQYHLDEGVTAYINGNKLFQRHMALVGNSGCGKSWTVATLLEQMSKFPNANLVVFDIHGEYHTLKYAKQLRIAAPGDSESADDNVLFWPMWFLSFEEMLTILLDESDPDASNQAMILNNLFRQQKLNFLKNSNRNDLLNSFTVDSPIPFSMQVTLKKMMDVNKELVEGITQGEVVKGPFYGRFDRLIPRLESIMADKRYNFMFQGPEKVYNFNYINQVMKQLMGTGIKDGVNNGIKILDLSMVPSDMIPVIIGALGRFLFQAQFWNTQENRHPITLICDESHLYLPVDSACNTAQKNTVKHFGRIAKEGRKYGITLAIVTQRPSDVNTGILSQCGNIMTLGLTNTVDQEITKKLMPDGMSGLIEELPLMGVGEVIVIGDSVNLPMKIKVSPPSHKPASDTLDCCTEWSLTDVKKDINLGIENMRKQSR